MKTIQYDNPSIGCWIDASCQSADDCNRRTIEFAEQYGFNSGDEAIKDDDYSQWLSETAEDAIDFLNGLESRSYLSWQFEDNSLFLMADVDSAKEDVGFVSVKSLADARRLNIETEPDDSAFPPADYEGEWLHVSDHGNATLYVRENGQDKEIWSVV